MKETLKQKEAFELYYSLGDKRSLMSVARQCGVSERTVARWSKLFNWQERVEQRDIENARRLEEKTNETVVATKANYRKIIKAAIGRWVKRFQGGEIDVESVWDLERLVKLDLLLMGEPTDRSEHESRVTERHEYDIVQRIIADPEARELARRIYVRVAPGREDAGQG
mgnify:CR=1 FL=1